VTAGTGLGLATACWIPYLMMTRHEITSGDAFGGWLMPIVPPMVSAATGALLIPYASPGQPRLSLLLACYAMFGISLLASSSSSPALARLVVHKTGPAVMVPPCGSSSVRWQSVTAAGNLGTRPPTSCRPLCRRRRPSSPCSTASRVGFAMMWLASRPPSRSAPPAAACPSR